MKPSRILNLTRNCYLKLRQAQARVEAKTAVWVDSRSIRELSLKEVLAIRSETPRFAAERSIDIPLGTLSNEIPGLRWEPPESDKYAIRTRYPLMRQAIEFLDAH